MTHSPRAMGACAAAVALVVGLSGCGLLSGSGDGDSDQSETVRVPVDVPVTFSQQARWASDLLPGTNPVELEEGVAVILPGAGEGTYRVALLSPSTGSRRWVSDTFTNPTPEVPPKLSTTSVDGQSWVIVETQEGKTEITLDAFSVEGSDDRRTPRSSETFISADGKTLPKANVAAEGVVVDYASNPELRQWQADVKKKRDAYAKERKAYTKKRADAKKNKKQVKLTAPKKPKLPKKPKGTDGTLAFDPDTGKAGGHAGPGVLRSVWSEGSVVTDPSAKSGFGFAVDGKTAWQSAKVRPKGVPSSDKGTLVAMGPGVLLGQWEGKDGKPMLAVHETRTGKVIASLDGLHPSGLKDAQGQELVYSADGKWVAWGHYVFGLKGNTSSRVDLSGGEVSSIYRDVLYVDDATAPLTAGGSQVTPPTEDGSVETDEGSDTRYDGMVDVLTGDPLTNSTPDSVPLFVSRSSQGVFVLAHGGKTRLYSTPLS